MSSVAVVEKVSEKQNNVTIRKRRKSQSNRSGDPEPSRKESLGGALARALVGTLAFVFRAPIRLFRPVKLSSWNLLEAMAKREGKSLSLKYLRTIIRRERSTFLPHLLFPPLLVNTTIGFCLFEVYSLTESRLIKKHYPKQQDTTPISDSLVPSKSEPSFTPLRIVAIAGGAAGAAQCIVSAPLDNIRIILSSNMNKHKGQSHKAHLLRHPLGISWRAIARAAILPFAPEITRSKLVDNIKTNTSGVASKYNTRLLWEKRIKRWRGGVHGAGLIMSLARDSVGFSAFFVVFEMSRRLAFKASLGVDRALAMFNTSATLPVGQGSSKKDDDTFHLESTSPGDISSSQSRTKIGRIVAALVLVFGGAIGAALYEVVGRPAELMRIVIWEGRKAWEEGRRGTKRDAWRHERGRMQVIGARNREKVLIESAQNDLKKGSFLTLRRGNRNGTALSKVQASCLQRARRPPHPLKLNSAIKASSLHRPAFDEKVREKSTRRRTRLRLQHNTASASASTKQSIPTLETRPSAYILLLEHAQRTSVLRYTSDMNTRHHTHPTPVPKPVLLFHTYFIAPFSQNPSLQATFSSPLLKTTSKDSSRINNKTNKSISRFPILNLFNFRYPVTNGPGSVKSINQAQVWGTGRFAWALRRLASPYSIGFLTFAWMSGDLA